MIPGELTVLYSTGIIWNLAGGYISRRPVKELALVIGVCTDHQGAWFLFNPQHGIFVTYARFFMKVTSHDLSQ